MVFSSSVLAQTVCHTVIRAEDLDRAKEFYENQLGLEVVAEPPPARELRVHAGSGSVICIYERHGMAAPLNTVACFEVDSIEVAVADLKARGVVFEEYDMPEMGLKTVNSIATVNDRRRAWFKDSEGNVLVVAQNPEA